MHIGWHHPLLMLSGTFRCNTLFTNFFKLAKINEQKFFSPDVCLRSTCSTFMERFQNISARTPSRKKKYLNVKSCYPFLQKFHWPLTLQKDHDIFQGWAFLSRMYLLPLLKITPHGFSQCLCKIRVCLGKPNRNWPTFLRFKSKSFWKFVFTKSAWKIPGAERNYILCVQAKKTFHFLCKSTNLNQRELELFIQTETIPEF